MLRPLSLTLLLLPVAAPAAEFAFCWEGGGGYTMVGRMTVSDFALSQTLVTEADVTAFNIQGFQDGRFVGSWDMRQSGPTTTFHLRFDPAAGTFPMGGSSDLDYQAWNADGTASNCGNPGFGFNAGNNAQDVCINGSWITESMIDRWTPLEVVEGNTPPPCGDEPQISRTLRK